jgi:hypothetical protein
MNGMSQFTLRAAVSSSVFLVFKESPGSNRGETAKHDVCKYPLLAVQVEPVPEYGMLPDIAA